MDEIETICECCGETFWQEADWGHTLCAFCDGWEMLDFDEEDK